MDFYETYLRLLSEMDAASVFVGHSGPNDTYATGDSRNVIKRVRVKKKKRKKM